jgi:hypothetical protein
MPLSEQRILEQVTILADRGAANVQWADQVLRDGVVISETPHRKAYTADNKDEFLAEVENAEGYLPALGWA